MATVAGNETFTVGSEFNSFVTFEVALWDYSKRNNVLYVKRSSEKNKYAVRIAIAISGSTPVRNRHGVLRAADLHQTICHARLMCCRLVRDMNNSGIIWIVPTSDITVVHLKQMGRGLNCVCQPTCSLPLYRKYDFTFRHTLPLAAGIRSSFIIAHISPTRAAYLLTAPPLQ